MHLIHIGANVNVVDVYNSTPLHYACIIGDLEIVQCLVQNGANVNARNNQNVSPVGLAVEIESYQLVDFLVANGAFLPTWG